MIELQDVHKHYISEAGPVIALNGINLTIQTAEYVTVLGKSGAGKTTLVNVITALDRLTRGKIYIDGTAVHQLNEAQAASWRGKNIGIIFESFQLIHSLTVLQNVTMPMDFAHYGSLQQRKRRALILLEQVGIAEHANKYPNAVSGGQQQRIAIARALANDPPILIADEPTGRLDSVTAKAIYEIFSNLAAEGKTIIVMTHDPDLAQRAQRLITIHDGMIMSDSKTTQGVHHAAAIALV